MIRVFTLCLLATPAFAATPPQTMSDEIARIPLFLGSAGGEGDVRTFAEFDGHEIPTPQPVSYTHLRAH